MAAADLLRCLKCSGETKHTTQEHIDSTLDYEMELGERETPQQNGGYYDGF